jgi:hypothetical protein
MKPSQFQIDALKFIIESSKELMPLFEQIKELELESKEHTGIGCIYSYKIKPTSNSGNFGIAGGFQVNSESLQSGASLILRITDGMIHTLDVLSNGDNFPTIDPTSYSFEIVPINIIDKR